MVTECTTSTVTCDTQLCNIRSGTDVLEYTARYLVDVPQTLMFFDNWRRVFQIAESL